jgi:hypothetical protein
MMKMPNKTIPLTFPQVFLIGFLVILLLQYLTRLTWTLIILGFPLPMSPLMQMIPFILLFTALFVFLYRFAPKPDRSLSVRTLENGNKLFAPRYSPEQVFNILMAVSVIWLVFLLVQIITWSIYRHHVVI